MPTAITLLPLLTFDTSNNIFKGVFYGRAFVSFPPEAFVLPTLTMWKDVKKSFRQSIQLKDSENRIIALRTDEIKPLGNWGFLATAFALEVGLKKPDVYRLELLSANQLQLARPIILTSSDYIAEPKRDHSPVVTAFIVSNKIENASEQDDIAFIKMMDVNGLVFSGSIAVFIGFSYVTKPFQLEISIGKPPNQWLDSTLSIEIKPVFGNSINTHATVDITNLPLNKGEVYLFRLRFEGIEKTYPFKLI